MSRQQYLLWLPSAVLLLAACASPQSEVPVATASDSAGTSIVTSSSAGIAQLPRWRLQAERVLGSPTGPPSGEFYRISDVRLLGGGELAVVNGGTSEVRFYDAAGNLLASAGAERRRAPGVQSSSGHSTDPGDSIVVVDRALRRLTVLTPGFRVARTAPLQGVLATIDLLGTISPDEVVIQNTVVRAPSGSGAEDNPTELLVYDLDGRRLRALGTYPAMQWVRIASDAIVRPQFGPSSTFAAAWGLVWIGLARDYEVMRIDTAGRPVVRARWSGPSLTVGQDDRAAWRTSVLQWAESDTARAMAQAQLRETVYAERKTAYAKIIAGSAGEVWIQEYRPFANDSIDWLVVDGRGLPQGVVRTSTGLRILNVNGGRYAGVFVDDLGVEHVVRGRVHPGAGS